ncbi:hypothetical protein BaRGS_00002395 [Batillaria attramentaria]|uniref:Uncharacterized protein n=1 Tax=Batillaria attramentaria TaxID=370345 RepID=A0ABD0M4S7_9CAEN
MRPGGMPAKLANSPCSWALNTCDCRPGNERIVPLNSRKVGVECTLQALGGKRPKDTELYCQKIYANPVRCRRREA